jgi:hypothetical protein
MAKTKKNQGERVKRKNNRKYSGMMKTKTKNYQD